MSHFTAQGSGLLGCSAPPAFTYCGAFANASEILQIDEKGLVGGRKGARFRGVCFYFEGSGGGFQNLD